MQLGWLKAVVFLSLLLAFFNTNFAVPFVVNGTGEACTLGSTYYDTIQSAIDGAVGGETIIVCANGSGEYTENVVINKSVNIYGNESGVLVNALLNTMPVFNLSSNFVNISNFTLQGANSNPGVGVFVNANNFTISDTYVKRNVYGFNFYFSQNGMIYNCQVNDSTYGFYFSNSSNISVSSSSTYNLTSYPLYLLTSNFNIFENNFFNYSTSSLTLSYSSNNSFNNNIFNGSEVIFSSSFYNNFTNNAVFLGWVYLTQSDGNNIINNTINASGDSTGILVWISSSNNIINNSVYGGTSFGIYLSTYLYGSPNSVNFNNVTGNTISGGNYGMFLSRYYDEYGEFHSNNISNNSILNATSYITYITHSVCLNNIIDNNTGDNGLPIYVSNASINLENYTAAQITLCNAEYSNLTNVSIIGSAVHKNGNFFLYNSSHTSIRGLNITYTPYSMITDSMDVNITNSQISESEGELTAFIIAGGSSARVSNSIFFNTPNGTFSGASSIFSGNYFYNASRALYNFDGSNITNNTFVNASVVLDDFNIIVNNTFINYNSGNGLSASDYNLISNNAINGSIIYSESYNNISSNSLFDGYSTIYCISYCNIFNNTLNNISNSNGILTSYSNISNNTINLNGSSYTVGIYSGSGSRIINNNISNLTVGLYLDGNDILASMNNIINNSQEGINLRYSTNSSIYANTICNNSIGIQSFTTSGNSISYNTICQNYYGGIFLWGNGGYFYNNNIFGNYIFGHTTGYASAIYLHLVNGSNNIFDNQLISSNTYGVYLDGSNLTNITRNPFTNNDIGIKSDSDNGSFTNNTFNYGSIGIQLVSGSENNFHSNNLFNLVPTLIDALNTTNLTSSTNLSNVSNTFFGLDVLFGGVNVTNTTEPASLPFEHLNVTGYLNITNYTESNVTVYFGYNSSYLREIRSSESLLDVYKYNGSDWIPLNTSIDQTNDIAYAENISSFSVFTLLGQQDLVPPVISIQSPENTTYEVSTINLNFTAYDSLSGMESCWYSNDSGITNASLPGCNNISISGYSHGAHTLTVYANDTAGNTNSSNVSFSINRIELSSCANLTVANAKYILISNVSSNTTCFIIAANNVTLNGNGYAVTYGNSSRNNTFGVYVNGTYSQFNITNLNLVLGNSSGNIKAGMYIKGSNGYISNNTITTNGYTAYGMYLITGASNNSVFGNTITTNGSGAYGIYLLGNQNNTITNNTIVTSNISGIGVYVVRSVYSTIHNNSVSTFNSRTNGIFISSSNFTNITLNRVNTSGSNSFGLYSSSGYNNRFENNSVYASKSSSYQIYLVNSNYNQLINNTVSSSSNATGAYGIILSASNSNNLSNNTVSEFGYGAFGLYVLSSEGNLIYNNRISSNKSYALYYKNSGTISRNQFYNNIFNSSSIPIYAQASSSSLLNTTLTAGTNIISGTYIGGNFWTNKLGKIYPLTCSDSNFDGICDSPYYIAPVKGGGSNNTDYLPLTSRETNPPSVNITTPLDGTFINGRVLIRANAADDQAVKNVTFYYKNSTSDWIYIGVDAASPYMIYWDSRLVAVDDYTINATAYDYYGNSASDTKIYTIDRDVPQFDFIEVIYPTGKESVRNDQIATLRLNTSDGDIDSSGISYVSVNLTNLNTSGITNMTHESGDLTNGYWSIWNLSVNISGNTGLKYARIYAYDNATPTKNVRNSDMFEVRIDNEVPVIEFYDSIPERKYDNSEVEFYLFATDNFDLDHYVFSSNISGTWENETGYFYGTENETTVIKRVYNGDYSYQFYVYDDAGNYIETAIENFTVVDPPILTISLMNPENNLFTNINTIDLNFSYAGGSASNCTWYVNGESNYTIDSPMLSTNLSNSQYFGEGGYTWSVDCIENDTEVIFSSEVRYFVVDTSYPIISIDYPTNELNLSTNESIELNFTVDEPNLNYSSCVYFIDGGSPVSISNCDNILFNVSNNVEGRHNISVHANDTAGNQGNSSLINFTIDKIQPNVTILSPSAGYSTNVGNSISISVNANDSTTNISSIVANISKDGSYYSSFNLTYNLVTGLYEYSFSSSTAGTYNLTIIANDSANNINSSESVLFTLTSTTTTDPPITKEYIGWSSSTICPDNKIKITTEPNTRISIFHRDSITSLSATANSEGIALFTPVGEGTYDITLSHPGYRTTTGDFSHTACPPETVQMSVSKDVLCPENQVRFTILNESGTTPISDARISFNGQEKSSDSNGQAVFDLLPRVPLYLLVKYVTETEGEYYELSISKEGYETYRSIELYKLCDLLEMSITSRTDCPGDEVIFTVVEQASSTALPGVLFIFNSEQKTTNSSGQTWFNFYSTDTYEISASKDGYSVYSSTKDLRLCAPNKPTVNWRVLCPDKQIQVLVTHPYTYAPIQGASVGEYGYTNEEGVLRFPASVGSTELIVSASSLEPSTITIRLSSLCESGGNETQGNGTINSNNTPGSGGGPNKKIGNQTLFEEINAAFTSFTSSSLSKVDNFLDSEVLNNSKNQVFDFIGISETKRSNLIFFIILCLFVILIYLRFFRPDLISKIKI